MNDRMACLERVMHAEADGREGKARYWRAKLAEAERQETESTPQAVAQRLVQRVARLTGQKRSTLSGRALRRAMLSRTR